MSDQSGLPIVGGTARYTQASQTTQSQPPVTSQGTDTQGHAVTTGKTQKLQERIETLDSTIKGIKTNPENADLKGLLNSCEDITKHLEQSKGGWTKLCEKIFQITGRVMPSIKFSQLQKVKSMTSELKELQQTRDQYQRHRNLNTKLRTPERNPEYMMTLDGNIEKKSEKKLDEVKKESTENNQNEPLNNQVNQPKENFEDQQDFSNFYGLPPKDSVGTGGVIRTPHHNKQEKEEKQEAAPSVAKIVKSEVSGGSIYDIMEEDSSAKQTVKSEGSGDIYDIMGEDQNNNAKLHQDILGRFNKLRPDIKAENREAAEQKLADQKVGSYVLYPNASPNGLTFLRNLPNGELEEKNIPANAKSITKTINTLKKPENQFEALREAMPGIVFNGSDQVEKRAKELAKDNPDNITYLVWESKQNPGVYYLINLEANKVPEINNNTITRLKADSLLSEVEKKGKRR